VDTVVRPTLAGLKAEGFSYRGFLYFGLMLTADGPKVLEYNCRLGDPETQAVMLRADFDLGNACMRAAQGNLKGVEPRWTSGASVCVVIASKGYPGDPQMGVPIHGLEEVAKLSEVVVFHAGTRRSGAMFQTNGGRVLGVCAMGKDMESARRLAYEGVHRIKIEGAHYRQDIGMKNSVAAKMRGG
jgi:phosphoribosylamine---glycine ligase